MSCTSNESAAERLVCSQQVARIGLGLVVSLWIVVVVWSCLPAATAWKWKLAWLCYWRGGVHDVRLYEWGGVERRVQVRHPDRYASDDDHDFALAVLLLEDGQYNEASELAWQLDGTHRAADGRELIGVIYAQQGIHMAAVQLLRRLHAEHPGRVTVRQTLIWVLAQNRRTIDEAQALAWQAASEQVDWSAPHMLRGIRKRQFWWLLRRVLMLCAGSTALLAMGGAMVRMLLEQQPQGTGSPSRTASPTGANVVMNGSATASAPPRTAPLDPYSSDVGTLIWHAVNLLQLVGLKVTPEAVSSLVNSAPRNEAEYFDVRWRSTSSCFKCLRVIEATRSADVRHRETVEFWRDEFACLQSKSRAKLLETALREMEHVGVDTIYRQHAKRWRQNKRKGQR